MGVRQQITFLLEVQQKKRLGTAGLQYIGVCNITSYSKVFLLLNTVIYNIIEQHVNKELALTYDKNTYQNATRRESRVSGLCNAF